ncbi:MAG: 2-amino-4-hydroxy-6-hydroxymethyldihydropteridine diphosphokinase [Planctomycetota bacterium]
MAISFLSLGSNLGDRLTKLRAAVRAFTEHSEVHVALTSDVASLYETSPVGGPADQPPYLNSILRVRTSLAPSALLAIALSIEASLGRTRQERWEPRVIDIDLLFVGDVVIDSPTLTLPHPRLHERRFVLEPLSELAADLIHPLTGVSIGGLTQRLRSDRGTDTVMRIKGPEWVLESPTG